MPHNDKYKDLGYFGGPDSAAEVLRRIRDAVAERLSAHAGFKKVLFMDVSAYAIQAELVHKEGMMGGFSLPCRIQISPTAIGMAPRSAPPTNERIANSWQEAVDMLVSAWPEDPEAALATRRRLDAELATCGTD